MWIKILLQPFFLVFFWIGLWNIFEYLQFQWRNIIYLAVGYLGMVITEILYKKYKKLKYLRLIISMVFATLFWCGAWYLFDTSVLWIQIVYILGSLVFLLILEWISFKTMGTV